MTQEEKQLLLIDLCSRLPYGVNVIVSSPHTTDPIRKKLNANLLFGLQKSVLTIKPYLRPISSMTDKEEYEWHQITLGQRWITFDNVERCIDWLNSHHFDYRGLIEKSLAIVAPEGMYES